MSFEVRLAAFRKNAGLSQADLAKTVGAAQSTISQLEAGTRRPSYELLQALARSFGVTVGHLLSDQVEGLKGEEETHFQEYRSLSPEARDELRSYVRFLQQREKLGEEGGR